VLLYLPGQIGLLELATCRGPIALLRKLVELVRGLESARVTSDTRIWSPLVGERQESAPNLIRPHVGLSRVTCSLPISLMNPLLFAAPPHASTSEWRQRKRRGRRRTEPIMGADRLCLVDMVDSLRELLGSRRGVIWQITMAFLAQQFICKRAGAPSARRPDSSPVN
jgi:hypothetical protein